jgi:hypothetical protein
MGTGAQQAENWRESDAVIDIGSIETAEAPVPTQEYIAIEPPSPPSLWRETVPVVALALLGLAWIAASGFILISAAPTGAEARNLIEWIALASGPLALIGIFYLLLRRTSRREARRFAITARAMGAQADYLERVLAALSTRIDDHRQLLGLHAEQIVEQGDRAAGKLGEISLAIRDDAEKLAASSVQLNGAAATARGDMDALMAALPQAEAQTREMSALLQAASRGAQEQAVTLAGQLSTVATHGREADEIAGTAIRKLAEHLARVEQTGALAEQRMQDAGAEMARLIDGALVRAADAVEETRKGIDTQSAAMLAMVEQGRAALDRAGSDAARSLAHRLDELGTKVDGLASRLAAQDAASHALIGNLDKALGEIERRFIALGDTGTERTADLAEAIVALSTHVEQMGASLTGGGDAADALLQRATLLRSSLDATTREISETLPAALDRIEAQAARSRETLAQAIPEAATLETSSSAATENLARSGDLILRQRDAIDRLGDAAAQQIAAVRDEAGNLLGLIAETERNSRMIAEGAGTQLVEALLRVRDTAVQAADHARVTLGQVIPDAARALGEASGEAMDRALIGRVEAQMVDVEAAAARAVEAANHASERLTRQMLTIAETTASVEARIDQAHDEIEKHDQAQYSRRVALLIESLNSIAIDVTKILSNEVTDSAWAAYLRGDRGIFTRRAVRLIDSGEARQIVRHYEDDPEFREHVNRYVHDFEAMLRHILASRESSPLGVTMLSSDMGKLYVALAQAIERLRK